MKDFLINTLIFLLVLVGSLLVGWHFIQEDVILFYTQVPIVVEEFETNFIETEETAEFDWEAVGQLEAFDWLQYVGIGDEVSPIGDLIIPSIGTRLPIFHGIGEPNISIGAGTMLPGMVMGEGNYTLASHWDPNPGVRFGGLDRVQIGDILILRDSNYLYIYETIIGNNYIIGDYRSDIVDYVEGKIFLTLFTCTPDGFRRVKVRGELVDQLSVAELREMVDLAAEMEILANLSPSINVEEIIEVVEELEYSEIPFPIVEVALAVGGSFLLASFVVWIANLGARKKK